MKLVSALGVLALLVLAGCVEAPPAAAPTPAATLAPTLAPTPTPEVPVPERVPTATPDSSGPEPVPTETPTPVATPAVQEYRVEGDDFGLHPSTLLVQPGRVRVTFYARSSGVYYGGLDFRGPPFFTTGTVLPGNERTVEFDATTSFSYASYWPATNVKKADGRIDVAR